ncbi:MAG: hypothetical protein GQ540_03870 [Lutibacter sp.]|uniref:AAA family ATPase n=1 Tax=Lutibacter sp. TaxID=1925666 RepID=UPI0019DB2E4C|nr:AAA family ATPase [Lutibacter sp.]NOR27651.1 hypothetical protein [Lutibacter sp.]
MLKTIKIKNVQNHKNTELILHPNVNIISGSSNMGKSAIFRAVDIVLNNSPNRYSRYMPWDLAKKKKTKEITNIDLVFEGDEGFPDGTVNRQRNKSNTINDYNIPTIEDSLNSFGHNPPDEVKDFLSLEDYSFRDQEHKYFFINEKSSERARMINRATDLSIIDQTQIEADANIKRIDSKIKISNSNIKDFNKSLLKYENLDKVQVLITKLDDFIKIHNKLEDDLNLCDKISADLNKNNITVHKLSLFIKSEQKLKVNKDKIDKYQMLEQDSNQVNKIISCINENIGRIDKIKTIIDLEGQSALINSNLVEFSKLEKKLKNCQTIYDRVKYLSEEMENITDWLGIENHKNRINKSIKDYISLKNNVDSIEKILYTLESNAGDCGNLNHLIEIKEIEKVDYIKDMGICPICGNKTGDCNDITND